MVWRPPPAKAYKPRDARVTSRMMARVRSRDNSAERILRRALHAQGLRFRLHSAQLPGKPDIVFSRARIAVFVDGDFWHGRGILEDGVRAFGRTMRTTRRDWWVAKIQANIERDRRFTDALIRDNWFVIRLWESVILSDVVAAARRVAKAHKRRLTVRSVRQ